MKAGTTSLFSKAATTPRIRCSSQASRQQHKRQQPQTICYSTASRSRRPEFSTIASRPINISQRRVRILYLLHAGLYTDGEFCSAFIQLRVFRRQRIHMTSSGSAKGPLQLRSRSLIMAWQRNSIRIRIRIQQRRTSLPKHSPRMNY